MPPPGAGRKLALRSLVGLDALSQLKSRPFVIFILSVMLTRGPLATYCACAPVFLREAHIEILHSR